MHWRERTGRRPVINEPGHAHELTFTCHRRYPFLRAERTCAWLADAIDHVRQAHALSVWAYVFMPEHVHLLILPRQAGYNISTILKDIKEPVGRAAVRYLRQSDPEWLPRLTVRHGQRQEVRFWQPGGGFDRNVIEAKTLAAMIDYIHHNPVRRGLVAQPHEWKWSSAGWLEGLAPNSLQPDLVPAEWGVVAGG